MFIYCKQQITPAKIYRTVQEKSFQYSRTGHEQLLKCSRTAQVHFTYECKIGKFFKNNKLFLKTEFE